MKNYIDRLPAVQDDINHRVEKASKDAVSLLEQAKQPFQQAADLEKAREEHKTVQRALMAKGPEVPENQKADVAKGIEQQKAKLRELGYGEALDEFFANANESLLSLGNPANIGGVSVDVARGVVSRIVAANKKVWNVNIHTVASFDDLPANVKENIAKNYGEEAGKNAKGLAHNDEVYVIAENNESEADVEQTLLHEINGHIGIRKLYGTDITKELNKLFVAIGGKKGLVNLANDRGITGSLARYAELLVNTKLSDETRIKIMMDEALAHYAESPKFGDKVKAIVGMIRAWLRNHGFTNLAEYGETDLLNILREGRGGLNNSNESTSNNTDINLRLSVEKTQKDLFNFFGKKKQNKSPQNFGTYHTTLSTQYHKALIDPHYGKVFAYANAMQNEVSLASIRPAELAPGVLPRVDDIKLAAKGLFKGRENGQHLKKVAGAMFAGTLSGSDVYSGKVWKDTELKDKFAMDATGITLYRQARAAIDASLDELAAAEAFAMAQNVLPKDMRRTIIDSPDLAAVLITTVLDKQISLLKTAIRNAKLRGNEEQQAQLEGMLDDYKDTIDKVGKIFTTATKLKKAGYTPLMRFGKWTVTAQVINPTTKAVVRDEDGNPETEYFGKFETEGEAMAKQDSLREQFKGRDDISITSGIDSKDSHELYAGVSPETIALFGDAIGAGVVTEKYYKIALSERSSLKRKLERKGTPGFNDDLPRVLSNFITSNARFAAQRYYLRDLNDSIKSIPKEKGDVKDEAIRLKQFIIDPNDPAAPLSTVMFAWFLGGSVAAAMVNLSQPFMMTGPYLSQFGIAKATTELTKAMPIAMGLKEITNPELRTALKRASREGVVDAQEIFHLYSLGAQSVATGLIGALSRISQPTLPVCMWMPKTAQAIIAKTG